MDLTRLLTQLSEAPGVAGLSAALDAAGAALRSFGPVRRDTMGSLFLELDGGGDGHILLDAHIDEIGFTVTSVTKEGFLRVAACGGIDRRVLSGAEVIVHGTEPLLGVFCSMPPHLSKEQTVPELSKLAIDIGYSREEAEKRVRPGDRVTFRQRAAALQNGLITGKSLDNRAGAAAVILAAELLANSKQSFGKVTVLLSAQEELGCQGAKTGAFALDAIEAVSVDVSFGRSFCHTEPTTGVLGKGPMIGVAPVLSRPVTAALEAAAKAEEIPYQYEGMGGKTSTNADVISVTRAGIPCGLVSIPLRYMHTAAEVVALSDVEHTGRLLAEYVLRGGMAGRKDGSHD